MDLRHLLLHPRPDRGPPDRHGTVASGRLGHRGARPRRRLRGHPASPDGHRARGRPPRGGRILRAHPVQPVALRLARRDPRRDRRRAGDGHRGRPHRRGAPPARCTRPRGDAGERAAGRARFDDPPADRRPGGPGRRPPPGRPRARGDPDHRVHARVGRGRLAARPVRRRHRATGGRRAGQRLVGLDRSRRADPGLAPGDRRPDRDADPPGLRSEQHAGRAADRGRRRHRGDHPVLPHGRRLAGDDPPPAVRRGRRGVVGHVAGLLAPGGRDERLHRRADRPARTAATSTSSAACSPAAAARATRSAS